MNKYGVKCATSLRFWENKGWINQIDPYRWFQWYFGYWLGRRSNMIKGKLTNEKKNVSRFRGKSVKMIKDAGIKFDIYSILPNIRQILLHWGHELTEKVFFINLTN